MRSLVTPKSTPSPARAAENHVRTLSSRAQGLRAQAQTLPEPLATTYRRRACELDLEAMAYGARHSVTDTLLPPMAA